ncbi:7-ethoxycoumarin O-deethylase-like [Cryptomeria japonica]|uniref:7-ethoxycoumarin O-deethylase-like n=1 Tax=Cryptomeria japonica TaxID=3369 RepID=UPI0027D9E055|nr:7-ethoxycoumarin O-deethylase-like [Cryptomeria japonica]
MIFEMKGNSVNIPHTVFFTGLNLIANMIFSRSMLDPNHKESMDFMEAFTTALMLGGKPNLDDSFPFLAFMDPQGVQSQLTKCYKTVYRFIDSFIKNQLEGKERQKGFSGCAARELLVAGSDTTSTAIEWIMTELIRHPNVLKRAREELEEKGPTRTTTPQVDDLEERCSKHIDIHAHFVRHVVEEGKLKVAKIDNKVNLVDILTKVVPKEKFECARTSLGLVKLK